MSKIRILILDDHTVLRQSIATVLNAEPDMHTIHCGSVGEALLIVGSGLADIVLLDVDLGAERGTEFLELARRNGFRGPVLVLTAGVSHSEKEILEQQGISGILLKDASIEALADSIRKSIGAPVPPVAVTRRPSTPGPTPFNTRESEVLRLVIHGLANKEIATAMNASEPVVKSILQQLFRKTSTHSRSQLVCVALEHFRDQI